MCRCRRSPAPHSLPSGRPGGPASAGCRDRACPNRRPRSSPRSCSQTGAARSWSASRHRTVPGSPGRCWPPGRKRSYFLSCPYVLPISAVVVHTAPREKRPAPHTRRRPCLAAEVLDIVRSISHIPAGQSSRRQCCWHRTTERRCPHRRQPRPWRP